MGQECLGVEEESGLHSCIVVADVVSKMVIVGVSSEERQCQEANSINSGCVSSMVQLHTGLQRIFAADIWKKK